MKILDGKKISAEWQKGLKKKLKGKRLDAVIVGRDSASILYLKKKGEMAEKLGVDFTLHEMPTSTNTAKVVSLIKKLNEDRKVDGIIVQLPMPREVDDIEILETITPEKDVDGLTSASLASGRILPATAKGILHLLASYKIPLTNQAIALVGFTRLLNVALSVYFSRQGLEVVVLQKDTKDMSELKNADIIVTAVGVPSLIKASHIHNNAVVVDAGIARKGHANTKGVRWAGKKVVGDVDFDGVEKKVKWLTPVPGGVGPMTVTALFANLAGL